MNIKILITFLLVTFIGCATSSFVIGNDFDLSKVEKIQKNKTTKQEVLELFGHPYQKTVNNSVEVWTYQYMKSVGKATSILIVTNATARVYNKNLIITFDDNGIVQSINHSESGNPDIK